MLSFLIYELYFTACEIRRLVCKCVFNGAGQLECAVPELQRQESVHPIVLDNSCVDNLLTHYGDCWYGSYQHARGPCTTISGLQH
jgi:hypothetical protein